MSSRESRGLLIDTNIDGFREYLQALLVKIGLWSTLIEADIEIAMFAEVGIEADLPDRPLWNYCQRDGWVLFTDNRNREGDDSLQATLDELWAVGDLPVLTVANKERFRRDSYYATQVASEIAEILFGVKYGEFRDQPRISSRANATSALGRVQRLLGRKNVEPLPKRAMR